MHYLKWITNCKAIFVCKVLSFSLIFLQEITAANSAFYNCLEAKSDAQFEKIVRTSSESIRTTCEQLLTVVQGRLKTVAVSCGRS